MFNQNPCTAPVAIPKTVSLKEVDILMEFFEQTRGKEWKNNKNWGNKDADEMYKGYLTWYGTTWENGHVVSIELEHNNLHGKLPTNIGLLKSLRVLKLRNNPRLEGSIPTSLFKSKSLRYCYVDNTELDDTLPHTKAHTIQITKTKGDRATVQYLLIGKSSRWIVDIKEPAMFMISGQLRRLRPPPPVKAMEIARNFQNTTGAERVEAALKLQRAFRRRNAKKFVQLLRESVVSMSRDEETHEVVYLNQKTGARSSSLLKVINEPQDNEQNLKDERIENQWQQLDDDNGNKYYWNVETGEVQWDIPDFKNRLDDELIQRYGKNTDPEERYRLLFAEVDKDGSGSVEKHEFAMLCGDLGMPMSVKQIEEVFRQLDSSGDGTVSQSELTAWLKFNYSYDGLADEKK